MSERENLLISASDEVPLGLFVVARIKELKRNYGPKDIEEVYHGEATLGSELMGWGIALRVSQQGLGALMIFNPNEMVEFPENVVED